AMKGDRERCLAAGMDAYLSKPIRSKHVLEEIERAVAPGRSARPPREAKPSRRVQRKSSKSGDASKRHTSDRLDKETALAAVNGDEDLLRDVVDAFFTEAPELLDRAAAALSNRNGAALKQSAHTLKGALSSFGEHPSVALAIAVERAASDDDFAEASAALDQLRTTVAALIDDL